MSGKPGRSGRPTGAIEAHKAERNRLIAAYYLEGHTVRETAKVFGISPTRVGQIVRGLRAKASVEAVVKEGK